MHIKNDTDGCISYTYICTYMDTAFEIEYKIGYIDIIPQACLSLFS